MINFMLYSIIVCAIILVMVLLFIKVGSLFFRIDSDNIFRVVRLLTPICLMIVLIIPRYCTYVRFNVIFGGDQLIAKSETKEESIKRGVFIGNVVVQQQLHEGNDAPALNWSTGWIEKTWRNGYWYWTTHQRHEGYTIIVPFHEPPTFPIEIGKREENLEKKMKFSINDNYWVGFIAGELHSDTLCYSISKPNNTLFSTPDSIGELVVYIERENGSTVSSKVEL